ncbi:MAG: hypothetical protein NTY20_04290 [Candidatus Aenigmarchaeota archaeon]|nr:hypothetical protein [Candidatus Aenigmarchaeota archaeon]
MAEENELLVGLRKAGKDKFEDRNNSFEKNLKLYESILEAAYRGNLSIDPLKFPSTLISDLQDAGLLSNTNYRKLTALGRKYIEKQIMV